VWTTSAHASVADGRDVPAATFTCPDLTTFRRLDELGLEVMGSTTGYLSLGRLHTHLPRRGASTEPALPSAGSNGEPSRSLSPSRRPSCLASRGKYAPAMEAIPLSALLGAEFNPSD
jgi:hypothetical protein